MTAQEEERKKIARELHDDCGQRFACLIVELSFAAKRSDVSPDLRIALDEMGENLRKLAQDLQQISRGLHSAVLDTIGLEAAIRSECDALLKRAGMSIEFVAIGIPPRLPAEISLTLYRVFQEAMKNALAYSQAARMEITLEAEGNEIMLQVRDFGRGFDIGSIDQGGGLGLISMRERIQMVGGTLAVRSGPGEGTQVEAKCSLAV
jgi:signal transduction histidine kinase